MHRKLLAVALAVGMSLPAAGASAQPAPAGAVGIRLLDAPANRRDDPRARLYIVDHLAPGTTIRRRLEVSNNTRRSQRVQLYAAGAEIRAGSFIGLDGRTPNELSQWTSVDPASVELPPGGRALVTATIAVPAAASGGERYAAIWAELPPAGPGPGGAGVTLVNRVGVRVYLLVGGGAEPASDFSIDALVAARAADGTPLVRARVTNTGQRALDMSGELRLESGPGGLSAGPFPTRLGTTLDVGGSNQVEVPLDKQIPAGPWEARIILTSGRVQREATARITFPAGSASSARPVAADTVEKGRAWLLPLAVGLVVLVLILLLIALLRSRRNGPSPPEAGKIETGADLVATGHREPD